MLSASTSILNLNFNILKGLMMMTGFIAIICFLGALSCLNPKVWVFCVCFALSGFWSHSNNYVLSQQGAKSLCECALSKQVLLTDLRERNRFGEKARGNTFQKKNKYKIFPLHQLNATVFAYFIPEHIAGLHHLRLLRWGSQSLSSWSSSSSAMENNTSWNIIFQQQILLCNSISLRFTNLSASINTNLLKILPSVGGIYLITSPFKYESGGCIHNDLSCVLSRCTLSSLLFPSKAYLPGNRGSILKSSLLTDVYVTMLHAWYHIAVSFRHLTWYIIH